MEIFNNQIIDDVVWDAYILLSILVSFFIIIVPLPMIAGIPKRKKSIERQLIGGFILSLSLIPYMTMFILIFSLKVSLIISLLLMVSAFFLYISCVKEVVEENGESIEKYKKVILLHRNSFMIALFISFVIVFIFIYSF